MSNHRSGGRNNPSRGTRTQRRAAQRAARKQGRRHMHIPASIRSLDAAGAAPDQPSGGST